MIVSTNVTATQAALEHVVHAWNQAGRTWDCDALAAVYTEDALLFGGRPGHSVGREAIQHYFATYSGIIFTATMQMSGTELRVLGKDAVLVQGMVHFEFTLKDSEKTQSTLRATLVLRRETGCWLIADHHFSPTPATPPLGKD
jgi:uncharacterized protein (TIGR02246 family)